MSNIVKFPVSKSLSQPDALPRGKVNYVRVFPHPQGGWAIAQRDEGSGSLKVHPTKAAAVREALWHAVAFNAVVDITNSWEGWE